MLYVLLVSIAVLLVLNYFLTKDVLSPSFLLSAVFFIATLFAIIGNLTWKVNIFGRAVFVIYLGLLLISAGEMLARYMYARRKKGNESLNAAAHSEIVYSRPLLIALSVFSLVVTVLYGMQILSLARSVGYTSEIGSLLLYARIAMLEYGRTVNTFVALLSYFARGLGFVCLCLLIHNVLMYKKPWQGLKRNWLLLIPIFSLFALNVLSTSRNGFIMLVVMIFFYAFDRLRATARIQLWKIGAAGGGLLVVFFAMFLLLGKMRGGGDNPFNTILIYAGSPIVALDVWLTQGMGIRSRLFGAESFSGIHSFIARFVTGYQAPEYFYDFIYFPDGNATNIYTGFRAWISDFGIFGFVFMCLLVGAAIGLMYRFVVCGVGKKYAALIKCLYAYILYHFIMLFAAPDLTASWLTVTQIFDFLFIIFSYWLLTVFKFDSIKNKFLKRTKADEG